MYKHKRKYFIHIQILKKLKQLSIQERNNLLERCIFSIRTTDSQWSTKSQWFILLELGKNDFTKFMEVVMSKTDSGELLRLTSVLGHTVDNERDTFFVKWKLFETKYMSKQSSKMR